jgi:peptidylprolyl isomerase
MAEVKQGDVVSIHYTGRLADGTVFDSSQGRDPLSFEVGSGKIIPGLDAAIPGMTEGDKKTVSVEPAEAYGDVDPDAKQAVPRETIPDEIELEIGMPLQMQTQEGHVMAVTVDDMNDELVVLDTNHPLAGETLEFDIEVVKIGE